MSLEAALGGIEKTFRGKIVASYLELKKRYSQALFDGEWDTSGLSAGKFCEATFRFVQKRLTGQSTPFGTQIQNFADEARKLIALPATAGSESLRIIIPRALVFLYTLRNKRGIGHVGGDVEANEIDAATILRVCDWIICELVRLFHSLSLEEAQTLVDGLATRTIPAVWAVAGKKRVLRAGLSFQQQVLLLLYHDVEAAVVAEDLLSWTEYSNPSVFKSKVLRPLHRARLIDYDADTDLVYLSPSGSLEVEQTILPSSGASEDEPLKQRRTRPANRRKSAKSTSGR